MTERPSPTSFITQAQERQRNTFIDLLGIQLLEVSDERAISEMTFAQHLRQVTGVFHAGALIALADTTATYASLYWLNSARANSKESFPFTIQLSTNFIRNTDRGTVRAEAVPIHHGRTTLVVETRITDTTDRLLAVVTTTHLVVGN